MLRTIVKLIAMVSLLTPMAMIGGDPGEEKVKTKTSGEKQAACATKTETAEQPAKAETTVAGGMIYSTQTSRSGEVEISSEMRDALAAMVNTSSEGLKEVVKPDGTVTVDLEGRFQSAMVVSVGKDGTLASTCYSQDPNHKHDHDAEPASPQKINQTKKQE